MCVLLDAAKCAAHLCMVGGRDQRPSRHARLVKSTYAQALKPAAKWVRQRLTIRPLASVERHCHTSASLRPIHSHAGGALPVLPATC